MTQHLHRKITPGCYRCELGQDEARATEACDHEWMEFGGPGDEWRECFLCGVQEDQ